MMENIQHLLNRTMERASARAHGLVNRASQLASSTGILVALLILAMIGLLAVAAAIVIALTPQMGLASALGIVGGSIFLIGGISAMVIWRRLAKPDLTLEAIDSAAATLAAAQPDIHTSAPDSQLPLACQTPLQSPLDSLPRVDPIFVVASLGAAAALLGPSRLIRILGTVTAGVAVAKNLAPLAGVLHKYNDMHAMNEMLNGSARTSDRAHHTPSHAPGPSQ